MTKRKICVVVTARPSYSRVKTVLKAIKKHPDLELQLVVAASALLTRYGLSVNYISQDGFEIAARVFNVAPFKVALSCSAITKIAMSVTYITFASFLSFSTNSATVSTLMPAERSAGGSTFTVLKREATSTPRSAAVRTSKGFFLAFIMFGKEA